VLSNTVLISSVGTSGATGSTGTTGSTGATGTTGTTGIVGTAGTNTTLTLTSQTPILAAGATKPVISTVPTTYVLVQKPTTIRPSDRRLKTNIQRIGTHPLGIGIYSYDYVWGEHAVGVMADEVKTVRPEAVIRGADGYDRVDYSKLNQ
jgi:hypothetical protein